MSTARPDTDCPYVVTRILNMARKPQKVVESPVREVGPDDRDELVRALTNMQLHGAHPLIATNVKTEVGNLLRLAGRKDLADVWDALL